MEALDSASVCHEYHSDTLWAKVVTNCMTGMIVGLNLVLKIINISFIDAVGFAYNSDVVSTVVMAVFIS